MTTLEERLVQSHISAARQKLVQFLGDKKDVIPSDFIPMDIDQYIQMHLTFDRIGSKSITINNGKKKYKVQRVNGIMVNKGRAFFPLELIWLEAKKRGSKPLCLLEKKEV